MSCFWGRKSAPDVRPFVPAWLGDQASAGFARSFETQFDAVYRRNPVGQRPPSPIDLSAQPTGDGGLSLSWVRRSRLGWTWPAGTRAPLGESNEKYRITVQGSAGTLTLDAFQPQITVSAQVLADMVGTVTISVVQVGDFADSRPATISVVLGD